MKQLEEELTAERQQRQRLVIEMHRLEQKCDNLQSELQNENLHKVKSGPSDSNMTWDSKFMDTLDLDDLPVNILIFNRTRLVVSETFNHRDLRFNIS